LEGKRIFFTWVGEPQNCPVIQKEDIRVKIKIKSTFFFFFGTISSKRKFEKKEKNNVIGVFNCYNLRNNRHKFF
jgi:hypothetical protein